MVMAERHGGKRTPRNPAPVSGPGKLSRRTDGGPAQVNAQMTGMGYGENKDFMQIQEGAAMSASPAPRGAAKTSQGSPMAAMLGSGAGPLFSDTQRPDEPVTAGVNFGPGAGGAAQLNSIQMATADAEAISKYLPDLMKMAEEENTPAAFKRFVRYLRNNQGA